jgi:hypothetical protein
MHEYDLYVPVYLRPKRRLPPSRLNALKRRLVKKFGGITHFPQKSKGAWKIGSATFHDEIVILRVLAGKKAKPFWTRLKSELQKEWQQREILIVVRRVSVIR